MNVRRSLLIYGSMIFLLGAAGCRTYGGSASTGPGGGDLLGANGPSVREEPSAPPEPTNTDPADLAASGEGFVRIPAGSFTMGSPEDEPGRRGNEAQVSVTLTRDFWLQSTPVTQGAYQSLMGTNPSYHSGCGASCPVESVSWFDAIAYANALSRSEGLPECYDAEGNVIGGATVYDCHGYRLPTEAEWEYAVRAGTTTATYQGNLSGDPWSCSDSQPNVDPIAWYCGNAGDADGSIGWTQAVGTRAPNAWGLYDMLGNVWEWTDTWYAETHSGGVDPVGPSSGSYRVVRGGSWSNAGDSVRAGRRFDSDPGRDNDDGLGFRLARTAEP